MKEHIHTLKNTMYQVKGEVCGQTILPMPEGFDGKSNINGKADKNRYAFHIRCVCSLSIYFVNMFNLCI